MYTFYHENCDHIHQDTQQYMNKLSRIWKSEDKGWASCISTV